MPKPNEFDWIVPWDVNVGEPDEDLTGYDPRSTYSDIQRSIQRLASRRQATVLQRTITTADDLTDDERRDLGEQLMIALATL